MTDDQTDRTFVDTNILVYGHDTSAGEKFLRSRLRLIELWQRGDGVLSTQVLQEFVVNVTRKVAAPLSAALARTIVSSYAAWPVHQPTPADIVAASELAERYQLSFWDGLIVRSASVLGATRLLTEDLQHGQVITGVRVVNPLIVESDQPQP